MEFFKGMYQEKKNGTYGLFSNTQQFVMCTINQPSEYGLKTGKILDNSGPAQFVGFLNENEMHFVKMYNQYKDVRDINEVPTIQYDLSKEGVDVYFGNYTTNNRDFSSGKCMIGNINKIVIIEDITQDGLKDADEDLINSLLKRILINKF